MIVRTAICCVAALAAFSPWQQPAGPAAAAPATLLRPARVFDGEAMHEGWAVRVRGERIEAAGPAASRRSRRRRGHRPARADADAGADRRPLARVAARLQRDVVERPGLEGAAGAADGPRREPPAGHAAGRLHHHPRSRHRRRRIRRRRAEAGGRAGDHPRPAHDRHDEGDRRDRQLRAEGLRPAMDGAAGRRGGRRRDARPGRARPDRPRRRLDQGLRRLSMGRTRRSGADLLDRRAEAHRRDRRAAAAGRWSPTPAPPRACVAPCSPASRRSIMATAARPRSSS